MDEKYKVTRVRPVDMFPQTHHVENVVLLKEDFWFKNSVFLIADFFKNLKSAIVNRIFIQ
jgi:hypothetical protein